MCFFFCFFMRSEACYLLAKKGFTSVGGIIFEVLFGKVVLRLFSAPKREDIKAASGVFFGFSQHQKNTPNPQKVNQKTKHQ